MNEWRSQYGTGILVLVMLLTFIATSFTPLALAEPATNAVYKEQPLYEQQPNLPPRIIPIYFVKGTNRQMGYQLGYQTASEIQVSKNKRWLSVMDQCDWDYDEVIRHLKGFQYYIEKFTPEIIEDMIGMAQGCTDAGYPTCYLDILVINVGPWVMFGKSPTAKYPSPISVLPPEKYGYEPPEGYMPGPPRELLKSPSVKAKPASETTEGCSRWAAWGRATKDGEMICGDSFDGGLQSQFNYIAFPDKGHPFVCSSSYFGEVYRHPGMNSRGLWNSGGFLPSPRDIDEDYGLVPVFGLRHLIQFYDDVDKAKDVIIDKWKFTGGRVHNWIVAGPDSNGGKTGYIFELTGALNTYRKAGDFGETDWIAAANTFIIPQNLKLIPGLDPFKTDTRIIMEWYFFTRYLGDVDMEFAKMLYRWYDPTGKFRGIGHRRNTSVHLVKPSRGLYMSCCGTAGREVTSGGRWGHNLDTWYSFYSVRLKDSPAAVVSAARDSAGAATSRADTAMRKLKLNFETLASYLALKDLFFKATDEIYKGHNYRTKARLAVGNESLFLFSKALTKYTRGETMMNAICNLISPPPAFPEDLGLEPADTPPLVCPIR
jgi:hypothetical protein